MEYTKIKIAGALEYRASFILQTLTMMANDAIMVFFWWVFFTKFQNVNGWTVQELLMLQAILPLAYGVSGFFFGNRSKIAYYVADGKLDFYLTLPKNELFHLLISRSNFYDAGDIIFGLIMASLVLHLNQWPFFLLLTLLAGIVIISFGVIVGSIAFFMGNSEESSHNLLMSLLSFSSYPLPIFQGPAKIILFTVIPSAFVTGIPVELLRHFSWPWFFGMCGFTLVFSLLAIFIFKLGLRRYESGNLMNVRM